MNEYKVTILGAGLAGCEAALWLAGKGVQVELYEQKPVHFSPAHKSEGFAELICSNSLKAERLDSASGLLKEEMRRMGSRLLTAAEETRVAAGGALAVDRDAFSAAVTRMVEQCENITVHREQVETIDESAPILVATGPLTDGALADEIGRLTGDERLHFYDAVAPIVTAESLDYGKVFAASRYDRGEADYLNCPFNKAEYEAFHAALAGAERAPLHDFDTGAEQSTKPDPDAHGKKADTVTVYEGCMPIEIMAARGADTMRFGPLRPVGLVDPNTGHRPWANVQLRAENKERTLYNIATSDVVLRVVSVRRPHQDVDQANKRRVQRVAALIQVVVGKDRTVVLSDGANDRVIGQVGLDDHLAGAIAATGTARHLFQQVVGALPCAKVGQLEGEVGIDNAHERDLGKVEALCDHLGAQQHGAIGRIELLEQLFVRILAARRIGIHANNGNVLGKHLVQCVLDLLRAQTHFCQVATATFGATARGRGIGLHAPGRSTGVALQRVRALVIRKRGGAVVAGGHAAALAAHKEWRKAAAVMQQHGLLATLDHTFQAFHQRF